MLEIKTRIGGEFLFSGMYATIANIKHNTTSKQSNKNPHTKGMYNAVSVS